jgi:RNA polymerase sigma factor for flagellar operon FliA
VNAYARSRASVRDPERERLITEHIDMARRIALRVARRIPPWMSQEDLVAAAMIGLTEAADRYDDVRGEPFVGFAEKRIRGAVLDELRRGDMMPRRVRTTARKVGATIRELEQRLGRQPVDEEIAAAMGVTLDDYRENLEMLTHVSFVEIGAEPDQERNAITSTGSTPMDLVERAELVHRVKSCLGRLPERDATVLSLYYVEEFNYAQIGDLLGVSESRVCQLHARALSRLRVEIEGPMSDDNPAPPKAPRAKSAGAVGKRGAKPAPEPPPAATPIEEALLGGGDGEGPGDDGLE